MKTFFIVVALFVGAFILGSRQCSDNNRSSTKIVKTEKIDNSQSKPQVTVIKEEIPGWQYNHKENRPDTSFTYWYTPVSYTQQTEPFPTKGLNTGYRFKCEAILVELQLEDGTWTTFKQQVGTGKFFEQTSSGIFAKDPVHVDEITELGSRSTHMRFRPFNNEPMTGLKVSKVE